MEKIASLKTKIKKTKTKTNHHRTANKKLLCTEALKRVSGTNLWYGRLSWLQP